MIKLQYAFNHIFRAREHFVFGVYLEFWFSATDVELFWLSSLPGSVLDIARWCHCQVSQLLLIVFICVIFNGTVAFRFLPWNSVTVLVFIAPFNLFNFSSTFMYFQVTNTFCACELQTQTVIFPKIFRCAYLLPLSCLPNYSKCLLHRVLWINGDKQTTLLNY